MRYFHVNGEVKSPSMYPWKGEPTVLRAIGAAGGFTDWANRKKVQLNRSNGQKFTINCWDAEKDGKKDLPVFPGDYIYVPRKGPMGVWGL
jgi:polysaccharide export outer membrane protein